MKHSFFSVKKFFSPNRGFPLWQTAVVVLLIPLAYLLYVSPPHRGEWGFWIPLLVNLLLLTAYALEKSHWRTARTRGAFWIQHLANGTLSTLPPLEETTEVVLSAQTLTITTETLCGVLGDLEHRLSHLAKGDLEHASCASPEHQVGQYLRLSQTLQQTVVALQTLLEGTQGATCLVRETTQQLSETAALLWRETTTLFELQKNLQQALQKQEIQQKNQEDTLVQLQAIQKKQQQSQEELGEVQTQWLHQQSTQLARLAQLSPLLDKLETLTAHNGAIALSLTLEGVHQEEEDNPFTRAAQKLRETAENTRFVLQEAQLVAEELGHQGRNHEQSVEKQKQLLQQQQEFLSAQIHSTQLGWERKQAEKPTTEQRQALQEQVTQILKKQMQTAALHVIHAQQATEQAQAIPNWGKSFVIGNIHSTDALLQYENLPPDSPQKEGN